jgi:hypothetical protein
MNESFHFFIFCLVMVGCYWVYNGSTRGKVGGADGFKDANPGGLRPDPGEARDRFCQACGGGCLMSHSFYEFVGFDVMGGSVYSAAAGRKNGRKR